VHKEELKRYHNLTMDVTVLFNRFQPIHDYFEHTFPHLTGEYKTLARLGKITEELGELNSAVHTELGLQRQEKQANYKPEDVAKEWADVFNTVILMGMVLELDMPTVINQRLDEIYERYHLLQESK
jgi:NTP pyrophosphatase (non-canonical NTP hydrolase)